ncbi:MAG TPA: hypothetical protein PLB63_06660 [Planctomycetota bacterium]|nr:hypothetical protein [Planctomycetota bacterium]HQB00739.1 hypothetical protein [Planctomycetota bacterium]
MLWGNNVALGKQCWGNNVALGKQCCSGETMLLWGRNAFVKRIRKTHSYIRTLILGKCLLLWKRNMLWGVESCSETRNEMRRNS